MTDAALPRALGDDVLHALDERLSGADRRLAELYPGDPGSRQPVHTVYLPAHVAGYDTPGVGVT